MGNCLSLQLPEFQLVCLTWLPKRRAQGQVHHCLDIAALTCRLGRARCWKQQHTRAPPVSVRALYVLC